MNWQESIRECVSLAQSSLIRARILRQEATIVTEISIEHFGAGFTSGLAQELHRKARVRRLHARAMLQIAERANGTLYRIGGSSIVLPLQSLLNGRSFRSWAGYRWHYSKHKTFNGVDPE